MQGNLPWHEAIRIAENVHANLRWDALTDDEFPEVRPLFFFLSFLLVSLANNFVDNGLTNSLKRLYIFTKKKANKLNLKFVTTNVGIFL